jgi:hypothetical protein
MEISAPWQTRPRLWGKWTWNQWLGTFLLMFLGWLNLMWPLPALALLLSLLLVCLILIRPYIAIVLTTMLMGFCCINIQYTYHQFGWALSLFNFTAFLGLLCWCAARAAGLVPPYQATTLDLPLAIFWLSGVIALLWSQWWYDGVNIVLTNTFSYVCFLLISVLHTTPRQTERLFWLWFWLGSLTIVTTIATFFFGYSIRQQLFDNVYFSLNISQFTGSRGSLGGTMVAAKAIAGVMNLSIFCGLALMYTRTRRWSRRLIFISVLGMLFIHLLTISRLEVMGLFFGWLTFVYLQPQWRQISIRKHFTMLLSALAILLALIAMLGIFYDLNELLARTLSQEYTVRGYRFSAAQGRRDHMYYALTRIWETGGLGAGAGGIMRGLDPTSWVIHSPSFYFSFLTDHGYGFLSLILMGWIIINLVLELRWALRSCPDPRFKIFVVGTCSALMVFATAGLGDHLYHIYEMWVLLGFAVATVNGVRYLTRSSSPATVNPP